MASKNQINVHCISCSAPIKIPEDKKVVNCEYCDTPFIVPREVKDSTDIEKASAELAISRLAKQLKELEQEKAHHIATKQNEIDRNQARHDQLSPEIERLRSDKTKESAKLILPGILLGAFSIYTIFVLSGNFGTFDKLCVGGIAAVIGFRFFMRIRDIGAINEKIKAAELDLQTTYSSSSISQLRTLMRQKESSYNQDISALKEKLDKQYKIVD